jgi:hypothetical protein
LQEKKLTWTDGRKPENRVVMAITRLVVTVRIRRAEIIRLCAMAFPVQCTLLNQ